MSSGTCKCDARISQAEVCSRLGTVYASAAMAVADFQRIRIVPSAGR
jgi:hypothetical protein